MLATRTALRQYEHYIDGTWSEPADGGYLPSFNPADGSELYTLARGTAADVDRAVGAARRALSSPAWRDISQTKRGTMLRRLGDLIVANADTLARSETLDNGKLLREMKGQFVNLVPELAYYFGGMADKIEGTTVPGPQRSLLNMTLREPVGVVGAITPWNSPMLLTMLKLAPALAAGNTIVIKPSEHTSASVLDFTSLVEEAGFPAGVVNVVTGLGDEVGAALVGHPGVDKVSFTGGSDTGRVVARTAIDRFARVTLELGGKSPQIVFPDANIDNASMGVIAGIFAAAGQTCVAGSRVFLHDDIYDDVLERVADRARSIRIGDPLVADTELGPLAITEQLEKVRRYVQIGKDEGATLLVGGDEPDMGNDGYYFRPTVFTDVTNDMRIAQEEIFGPIAGIQRFSDEDEVVRLANGTRYGLAAGVWTRDLARAHRVAGRLDSGVVWVNTYRSVSPTMPLGGVKQSGLGRENGFEVIREYTRVKSVWINTSDEPMADPFQMQ
jgi:acyl-CoA reductase-like NAD-dependent aldehyde dehydrogenase